MAFEQRSREIKSVKRAFEIVHVLQALGGATTTRLIDELDLSKSSVHNYLGTLEQMGYVVNQDGTYRLGLRFLTHGIGAKLSMDTQEDIAAELDAVATELSAPTWWISEELGRGFFLEASTPEDTHPTYGRVGKRSYLHTHALGQALLAEAPDTYVERIIEHQGLPAQTTQTTTDSDALYEKLENVRENGFAVSQGGTTLGIRSVGAGFTDRNERYHAFGVFGDSRELTDTRIDRLGETLRDTVQSLEDQFRLEAD